MNRIVRPSRSEGWLCLASSSARGQEGASLIEVAISLVLILAMLLGVMASLSTASVAQMSSTESTQSQFLLSQVLEEVKNNSFDNLLSFNGQQVTSGTNRATISVGLVTADLVRVQVAVASTAFPEVANRAVLFLARLD